MIKLIEKGIVFGDPNSNIIFNPVSVSAKSPSGFNKCLRELYPNVYEEYRDYLIGVSKKKLLGDIQLVKINDNAFIMNAYVYDEKGNVNYVALCKALVELFNIVENYKINVAIPLFMYSKNDIVKNFCKIIVNTVFEDYKYNAYLYKQIPYKLRK